MGINGKKWIKVGGFSALLGAGLTGLVTTLIGGDTEDNYEEDEVEETEEEESEEDEEE